MRAVGAMYVRDPHTMGRCAWPADRVPEDVECGSRDVDVSSSDVAVAGAGAGSAVEVQPAVQTGAPKEETARAFTYTSTASRMRMCHIYTCNRPANQVLPDALFRDVQLEVPMAWQGATTRLATGAWSGSFAGHLCVRMGAYAMWRGAGPYFTYLAGDRAENKGSDAVPWADVPACVARARELMQRTCEVVLAQVTILGWHSTGSRKVRTSVPVRFFTL